MTHHLFGAVLTPHGIASNNRGENAGGNVSTLQKILKNSETYTTVSAEAVRYAMREYLSGLSGAAKPPINRVIDGDGADSWSDVTFANWTNFADDDLFGFMDPKKDTVKRRGRFEITRALSTRPWPGDIVFNAASPGAHPRQNADPIPYSVEVHATRYQYLFALTPDRLADPTRAILALDAVANLARVGGNHSRYLYEFAPDAIVLRYTQDPVPRMMYCYDETEFGEVGCSKLTAALESGDIDPKEIVVGGQPLKGLAHKLTELGATYHEGVKAAIAQVRNMLSSRTEA